MNTMIARKSTFAFSAHMLITFLGYIALFFIARYMGPTAIGMLGFAAAFVGVFSSIADLGFGAAHIKRISEGKDLGKCNGTYLAVTTFLTAIMTIAVLGWLFISKSVFHTDFDPEQEIMIYIILFSTIIFRFSLVGIMSFSARKEIAKQQIPTIFGSVFQVSAKIIVAVTGLSVIFLAGANLLGTLVAFIGFFLLFRSYPISKPNKEYIRSYLAFAMPMMFIMVLFTLSENLDKVMIQSFCSIEDVGYYVAPQRISFVLVAVASSVSVLLFPTISEYHSKANIDSIRNLSNVAERYISMLCIPVVAFVIVFAEPTIHFLLSDRFLPSISLLRILIVVAFVNAVTQPYSMQIGGTDRVKLSAKISAVVILTNILLNFLFIPQELFGVKLIGLGAAGAAIATLIAMSIGTVLFRFAAYKVTGTRQNWRILIHLFAAGAMGLSMYFVNTIFPITCWYHLIGYGLLSIVIYFGVLFVVKEFKKEDFKFFIDTVNPMKMKEYVEEELKRK